MNSLIRSFKVDSLTVRVYANQEAMAAEAAAMAREHLIRTLAIKRAAGIILASANSQIQFVEALSAMEGIDWGRITAFHMDEYLGISDSHPASFRRFMRERIENKLKPKVFRYLEGDSMEPLDECERYAGLLRTQAIDLCCLGIGENGHIAFNDPPVANFDDPHAVKIVKLDELCRMQQVGEGHFSSLESVPQYALTLTIPALCAAKKMICIVPEKRKAHAIRECLSGPVSTACPASILCRKPHCTLFLDADSASELTE